MQRVREYMRRELTHDSDAFNAFAGVLKYLETFAREFLLGNLLGLPVWSRMSRSTGHEDAGGTLLSSIAWSIPFLPDNSGSETSAPIVERREHIPSWTWCGWKRHGTSSPGIEWVDVRPRAQPNSEPDLDLCPKAELCVEYDGGEMMSWTPDGKPQDLLASAKTMGDVSYLRVCGWTSQLIIPLSYWNDGPPTCQCGAYRLERRTARCLSIAAQRRGLPLTKPGYYTPTMWFFAPLEFSSAKDNCRGTVMVLVPTAKEDF